MASLIVRDGPLKGQRIEVESAEMKLGREDTDLVIENDTEVSRDHAVVRPVDGGVEIEDLGSTNGTFVNERKITAPTRLSNGDIVRVGQTRLDVTVDDDPNATSVSGIVAPPTQQHSPTDLPIPVQRFPAEPQPKSDPQPAPPDESEARTPTSELPARQRVGGGAIQRATSKRGLLVALAVVVVLVAGYLVYSLVTGGAPSKQDFVSSLNEICEPQVSELDNLNVNQARNVDRGARLVDRLVADIEGLERPDGSDKQIDRFVTSFEKVGTGFENLGVSLEANNNKRARRAARSLDERVRRSDSAANQLGATECTLRN